ncbi:predicted protein [Lichtheimia corymbifera JMRC:FSU:9682]|uniref:Uncharacterized protein n=1 Tax=Lichtheimia corymbifera JMRC:FSU:9682 TaxID=1263082 RepID=A0A068SEK7_9FUNG|nr:predicted protein [Lichtheimia corymbifera JMRC:FSU:9682]
MIQESEWTTYSSISQHLIYGVNKILQSIRRLHLVSELGKDLVDIITTIPISIITCLNLPEIYPGVADTATTLLFLTSVQSTVTHLDMKMENLNYSLGDVLDTFQHLVSLTCHDINSDLTTASESYPQLKELRIWTEERGFESDDLKAMTRRLPALEIFSLKLIAYNDYRNEELYMQHITYKGINNKSGGGTSINNNDFQSPNVNFVVVATLDVDMLDIITSITRNSHSCQSIFFCYNSTVDISIYLPIYDYLLQTLVSPKNFHVGVQMPDLLGSLPRTECLSMHITHDGKPLQRNPFIVSRLKS